MSQHSWVDMLRSSLVARPNRYAVWSRPLRGGYCAALTEMLKAALDIVQIRIQPSITEKRAKKMRSTSHEMAKALL